MVPVCHIWIVLVQCQSQHPGRKAFNHFPVSNTFNILNVDNGRDNECDSVGESFSVE